MKRLGFIHCASSKAHAGRARSQQSRDQGRSAPDSIRMRRNPNGSDTRGLRGWAVMNAHDAQWDDQVDPSRDPTTPPFGSGEYHPDWFVDVGDGCAVGITIDDGCFMALTQDEWGYWNPTTHIPARVAARLGELAALLTGRYT